MRIPASAQGIAILGLLTLLILTSACSSTVSAQEPAGGGFRFTMVLERPGADPLEFAGMAISEDCSLEGSIGGIETVTLLTGGRLYSLTPAIMTAREINNPPPPELDEPGWPGWLVEFGRLNPLTFARLVGLPGDFDEAVQAGEEENVELTFDNGRLILVEFPGRRADAMISYTYRDFEHDPDLGPDDLPSLEDYQGAS